MSAEIIVFLYLYWLTREKAVIQSKFTYLQNCQNFYQS